MFGGLSCRVVTHENTDLEVKSGADKLKRIDNVLHVCLRISSHVACFCGLSLVIGKFMPIWLKLSRRLLGLPFASTRHIFSNFMQKNR